MMIDVSPLLTSLNKVQEARARLADIAETQVRLLEQDNAVAEARHNVYDADYKDAELALRMASDIFVFNFEQQLASNKAVSRTGHHDL